jgi:tetratricopeptide (TPR) repeat protein/O-antigen ligase
VPKKRKREAGTKQAPLRQGGPARPAAGGKARRQIAWPNALGEIVVIAMILAVPIVINVRSRNICDVKDVVLGLGVAFGIAVWLIASLARGRIAWSASRLNLILFAFVLWCGASILYSRYRYVTASEFGRLAANAGLFWLAIGSLHSLRQVRRVIGFAALVAIPVCIYGFYQAAGVDFVSWTVPTVRVFSFLGNPTYLGGFLVLIIPVVVAAAVPLSEADQQRVGRRRPWMSWLIAGLFGLSALAMAACLYYSVTLAAAIGLPFGGLLVALLILLRVERRALRVTLRAMLLVLVVLASVGYGAYRHLDPVQQARVQQVLHFQDPFADERRLHWQVALDIFKEKPVLGEGYGAFRVYSLEKMAPEWYAQLPARSGQMLVPGYAHNEYLQVLADVGIIGGLLFLALLVAGGWLALRVAVKHPSRGWAVLGMGLIASMVAFLFQNFFGVTFRQTGVVTFFWLWLALVVIAAASLPRPGQEAAGPRLREFRFSPVPISGLLSVGFGLAIMLALLGWAVIRPVIASMVLRRAQGMSAAGHYREGAELADRAISLCPYSSIGYYVSAYAWGQVGDLDKAVAANKKALALLPGNASVYYNLGVSYKQKGQLEEALRNFQQAVKLMPTSYNNQAAVAETLLQQGKVKEAEPYARETARLAPDDPRCHLLLADILSKQGKVKEMVPELDRAVQLSPNDAGLKQQLVQVLFRVKDYDRAAAVCREWMQLDPKAPTPHNVLGTYYFNHKQYAEARAEFQRAVALDPNYARARLNLAFTLGRLREYAGAREQLQYVASRAPGTSEGQQAQAVLDRMSRAGPPRPTG